ncbi:hypothetical protein E4U21_003383 [Claviceps maximensis]|nr:hypothetical protein E4U21_003383 [Claviceps maximensis]
MAHIANCVANTEHSFISKPVSPASSVHSTTSPASSFDNPFVWRMLPADVAMYQSYFKDKPLPSLKMNKTSDSSAVTAEATMMEKHTPGVGLRYQASPQAQASARRRNVSGPDMGPTTTVQEVTMDSPTIPGRPPVHERSVSVPSNTGDKRRGATQNLVERPLAPPPGAQQRSACLQVPPHSQSQSPSRQLSPLHIPAADSIASLLTSRKSSAKLRSDSTSPLSSRSAGMDMSPGSWTRVMASSSTPDLLYSRSAAATSTKNDGSSTSHPSLLSPPGMDNLCASSNNNWYSSSFKSAQSDRHAPSATSIGSGNGKSHMHLHHHRGKSESSNFGMDRGRDRKRVDIRNNSGPLLESNDCNGHKKRAISLERRAFEELPKGCQPAEASYKLSANDLLALQKQALEQAERFEVLNVDDVDTLSKELRQLDERTDYLRRTQTSLRAGRRSLHSRICQYLRSPRVAQFSQYSMLKQEESLADLDASIDEWTAKLDQAENRRTRVRQKLLEHVAAAAIIGRPNAMANMSESLQQVMGMYSPTAPRQLSTPPRSPTQSSFSSQSSMASPSPPGVVAQIPSTIIEQPVLEEGIEDKADLSRTTSIVTLKRGHVESIRIYAGDDVFALLTDVENEMIRMGSGNSTVVAPELLMAHESQLEAASERERQQERQRSHEKLHGHRSSSHFVSPWSSRAKAHMPFSPETSPTTIRVSRPTEPIITSKATASAFGISLPSNSDDAERLTPGPLASAANRLVQQDAGPFLTSAVFKP